MNRRRFMASSLATVAAMSVHRRALSERGGPRPRAAMQGDSALAADLRNKLSHDPLRPQFHFLPKANWMNDPCAPRFFRGEYHMFHQYNPGSAVWGDMHWGHAKSPDLIHWTHLPIALSPSEGLDDAYGCFTGSVLPGMATPTILYTGVTRSSPDRETIRGEGLREAQCLASSEDPNLLVWKKLDKPVLEGPPEGLKVTGFRDPCPWMEGDTWYLALGSGFSKIGGAVLLYRSMDGVKWTYLHPMAQGEWNGGTQSNPVDTGEMWECPDFFRLGEKHVLLYSAERKVYWQVGKFDRRDLKFHAETRGLLDHGSYYAMKSMEDAKGRRILWGWVEETRSPPECLEAGWAGAMSLPRVLTLTADNHLRMEVLPEFASLCRETEKLAFAPQTKKDTAVARLPVANRACRLVCKLNTTAPTWALELEAAETPGSAPLLALRYEGSTTRSSISIAGRDIPLSPDSREVSTLDIWIDGSVMEIFVDSREALTVRCYQPAKAISALWSGPATSMSSLQVSRVMPISSDRLTS